MTEPNAILLIFEQEEYLPRIKKGVVGKSFKDYKGIERKITDVDFDYRDFDDLFNYNGAFVSINLVITPYKPSEHFLYYDHEAEDEIEKLMKDFVSSATYSEQGLQGNTYVNLDVYLRLPWK